jgi:hypothetical protein
MQKKINNYDDTKKMLKTLRGLNEGKTPIYKLLREDSTSVGSGSITGKGDSPDTNGRGFDLGSEGVKKPVEFGSEKEEAAASKSAQGITNINNVDVKIKDGIILRDDQKNGISGLIDNFRSQVSQIVSFRPGPGLPGMTIAKNQIRLDGILTDNNFKFTLIAGQQEGAYINADMLKVTKENVDLFNKIIAFQATYKSTVEPMITNMDNNPVITKPTNNNV